PKQDSQRNSHISGAYELCRFTKNISNNRGIGDSMAEKSLPTIHEENQAGTLLARAPGRAILVGVEMPGIDWPVEESLEELSQLATTAGVTCVERVVQRLVRARTGTLIGAGKVQEIAEMVRFHDCDAVLFDLELTPGQHRSLERELETRVLDRTALI